MYGESSIPVCGTVSKQEFFRDRRPRHDCKGVYQELGRSIRRVSLQGGGVRAHQRDARSHKLENSKDWMYTPCGSLNSP